MKQKKKLSQTYRSSRPQVFCEKGVLRNFTKFTGKHLCQSLFLNKVAACNFIKKETLAQVFSCEFCEISKTTFFTEYLWWLLLDINISTIKESSSFISTLFPSEKSFTLVEIKCLG